MAWKSVTLSQPGNSTRLWIFTDYPHSPISSHDAIVLKNDGDLNVRTWIERIELVENTFGYTQYNIRVRTAGTGADAVSYRFFAEQMN